MRSLLLCVVILITVLLPQRGLAQGWQRFTSAKGHFSIEFPGKPGEAIEKDTALGSEIIYLSWFPNDSTGYMATSTDISAYYSDKISLKDLLEASRDGATNSISEKNVITTNINLGKEPYIEFSFTGADVTGRGRVYIVNKRQFSVLALFPRSTGVDETAVRFIRSFKYSP